MLFGEYQFISRFDTDAILPRYKGSAFRGAFGNALKHVACTLKQNDCDTCLLRARCAYPLVFETEKAVDPIENAPIGSPPPPFVLEPPMTFESYFPRGSAINIRLLLFGHVNEMLPFFILAVERMGTLGVGRRIEGKRGRFSLKMVKARERIIYSKMDDRILMDPPAENLELSKADKYSPGDFRLGLVLETPLRFKSRNHLAGWLSFDMLMRVMMRRVSSLEAYYGTPLNGVDYGSLLARAESVRILRDDLRWRDWQRYSRRQNRRMNMGGLTGAITYEGELREFMPFVEYCSRVHIGKQTTFGLGKIRCEYRQRD